MHDNSFDDDVIATEATSAVYEDGFVLLTTKKTLYNDENDDWEDREDQGQEHQKEEGEEQDEDKTEEQKDIETNSNETGINPNHGSETVNIKVKVTQLLTI